MFIRDIVMQNNYIGNSITDNQMALEEKKNQTFGKSLVILVFFGMHSFHSMPLLLGEMF